MVLRLIVLLVLVSPVVIATLWFSDNPGTVQVEWLGWRVDTNMPILLAGLLVVFLLLSALGRLSGLLADLPARLGHSRQAKGREKGMVALLAALDAAESGDNGEGRRLGAEAARLLGSPALAARLDRLMPRAATPPVEAARPEPTRKRSFLSPKAPLAKPSPQPKPSPPKAAPPPSTAVEETPPPPVAVTVRDEDRAAFAERVRNRAWDAALAGLEEAVVAALLPPSVAAHWRAVVLAAQAVEAADSDAGRALHLARDAVVADPGFLPAALQLIRLEVAAGRPAEAEAALKSAWRKVPARPLLDACAVLWADDDAAAHLARMEALAESNPGHREGHLAAGEAAVAAAKWGVARRHLMAAIKIAPDILACRLMAEVEEKESGGSVNAADIWRRKEREALPPPAWHCSVCGTVQPEWVECCPSCGGVATVEWTQRAEDPRDAVSIPVVSDPVLSEPVRDDNIAVEPESTTAPPVL